MKINVSQKTNGKIDKYWTRCIGSCHAATALREDWRKQLKICKDEFDFEFVRFHGIFDDDMSTCLRDSEGKLEYSFFNVDSIFDFLLSIGMKPFIEMSYMPEALASGPDTVFHYKGNITPPKDYDEWGALCGALAAHLVERYGIEEVQRWFFEVWNEPNLKDLFWSGTMEEYLELYKSAAIAIKKVDQRLPVGGPSTAINAWIPETIEFCQKNNLALDFITTHHYPTDSGFGLGLEMEEQMARSERNVLHTSLVKALEEAGSIPLFYTEWNSSPSPRDRYHDASYCASFAAKNIMDNLGLIDIYSFWTFTDIFEECGFSSLPFHGGFGLLNINGIPKPSYRAFQLLNGLKGDRLEASAEDTSSLVDFAASKDDCCTTVLVTNFNVLNAPIEPVKVSLRVEGAANYKQAWIERIDDMHANPKKAWKEMGSPTYPTKEQIQELMVKSEMVKEKADCVADGNDLMVNFEIQPHSVVRITLS